MDENLIQQESFLLNECYELSIQNEVVDISKELLRTKKRKLNFQIKHLPGDNSVSSEGMVFASNIYMELAYENLYNTDNSQLKSLNDISEIRKKSEREYILALLALRRNMSETGISEAISHLSIAYQETPNDPRIKTLMQILIDSRRKE